MRERTRTMFCPHCGVEFSPRAHNAKYCSPACRSSAANAKARAERSTDRVWDCKVCGIDISRMRADAKYCSKTCSSKAEWLFFRERVQASVAAYQETNAEKIREYHREYAKRNRKAVNLRQRIWVIENADHLREYHREYVRRWNADHPERAVQRTRDRRNRLRGNRDGVGVSERDWHRILVQYDFSCAYCGDRTELQRDHVIPVVRGGRDAPGNVVPACVHCNASKSTRLVMEWRIYLAELAAAMEARRDQSAAS